MTKKQLEIKRDTLLEELEKINKQLDKMQDSFSIDNINKPFKKYSMNEITALYNTDTKAYDWLNKHLDKSIVDYNNQASKLEKVKL